MGEFSPQPVEKESRLTRLKQAIGERLLFFQKQKALPIADAETGDHLVFAVIRDDLTVKELAVQFPDIDEGILRHVVDLRQGVGVLPDAELIEKARALGRKVGLSDNVIFLMLGFKQSDEQRRAGDFGVEAKHPWAGMEVDTADRLVEKKKTKGDLKRSIGRKVKKEVNPLLQEIKHKGTVLLVSGVIIACGVLGFGAGSSVIRVGLDFMPKPPTPTPSDNNEQDTRTKIDEYTIDKMITGDLSEVGWDLGALIKNLRSRDIDKRENFLRAFGLYLSRNTGETSLSQEQLLNLLKKKYSKGKEDDDFLESLLAAVYGDSTAINRYLGPASTPTPRATPTRQPPKPTSTIPPRTIYK